jgi:hypothetical protein
METQVKQHKISLNNCQSQNLGGDRSTS